MTAGVCFEDVAPGASITPLVRRPTTVQLFRFSAATWNAHRIHYDVEHARAEGYPGVLVQSHLHGCFLLQAVLDWAGPHARLRRFGWQNRCFAVPGDVLTCSGTVTAAEPDGAVGLVSCELEERNQAGELCAPGWATIELPRQVLPREEGTR